MSDYNFEESITPDSICSRCGNHFDRATSATPTAPKPLPGSVSICYRCGALGIFNDNLTVRRPTPEELEELEQSEKVQRVLQAFWEAKRQMKARMN
jgi:ribosomal protein L40E